jgi:LisH
MQSAQDDEPLTLEEELSLHELKDSLRKNFRDTGVLSDITARLRRQFVSELARKGLGVPNGKDAAVRSHSSANLPLHDKLLRSLVVDYLKANGLLQSLAVFLPESGLTAAGSAVTSRPDLLRGLLVHAGSQSFQRILQRAATAAATDSSSSPSENPSSADCGSLLAAMIAELAQSSTALKLDAGCQTDASGPAAKEALAAQLRAAQETWLERSQRERDAPLRGVEERMLAYQRECDGRAATELAAAVARFRETELTAVKLAEAAARRRDVDAVRKELAADYAARLEAVSNNAIR